MSDYQDLQYRGFIRGVNAVVDRYSQPEGSVPRMSNLIFTKRGSLTTVDGSQIVHAFNGIPTANRGKCLCGLLFAPTGVSRYYVTIQKALNFPLGSSRNLVTADGGAGGTLTPGQTYYYMVTALDGVGGESLASNEANFAQGGASHKVTLTWNVVPNATGYRVYRGIITNGELLLAGLTVSQVPIGTLTVSYTDDGSAASNPVVNVANPGTPGARKVSQVGVNPGQVAFATSTPHGLSVGNTFAYAGGTNAAFNATYTVFGVIDNFNFVATTSNAGVIALALSASGGNGAITIGVAPPVADTTQQTALYRMPTIIGQSAALPVPYTDANIVALYPADFPIDGGGGGGTGGRGTGGGTTGGGATGGGTPAGGIPGNITLIPEMVQYSNRVAIALGNGFPAQIYSDPTTVTNPAVTSPIATVAVDAFGVVTVTTSSPHGIPTAAVGANVLLAGITNPLYNFVGPTIQIVSATQFKVYNPAAIGQAGSVGGTCLVTSVPLYSTFTTAYPVWATGVTYLVGDIITPTAPNGHYYKCIQAGISAAVQPAFPVASGAQIQENSPSKVIWQEAGLTNATAPPPPAAAHIKVYAGSLFVWNTWYTNTANGLDGPTCLRMSDANNPFSWNPINQAFIDKDDGTEGSGLNAFTISGFGIPPEGSLVAFKQTSGYQIVGVFGSSNFLIQRIKSSLGCIAPRTIQFATGYGLIRFSHLGFAVYDGMNDRLIDDDIHPYIFPFNEIDTSDITTVDFNWMSVSWASQTAYPAMYVCAMPIGNSNNKLTRMFAFDMVLKAWGIVDLPFAISTMFQSFTNITTATTLLGTYGDGCWHRWQAGDDQWDNSIDTPGPSAVAWSVETPRAFNKRSQSGRIYCRQLRVTGKLTDASATISTSLKLQGEAAVAALNRLITLGIDGAFTCEVAVNEKVVFLDGVINGTGAVELNLFLFQIKPEVSTVPAVLD